MVHAYQLPPADCDQDEVEKLHDWANEVGFDNWVSDRDCTIVITTLEGDMTAHPGDWIVGPGVEGEFWPVKQSIFEQSYEEIE